MKTRTLLQITSILTLSLVAAHSIAAGSNPPKPRCPVGEIAVLEQGSWHCEKLTIKSSSNNKETNASKPSRATTAATPNAVKAQTAAQPDFTILSVKKMPTPGAFRVTVKNLGGAYGAKQANVWATHHRADGTTNGAAENMPQVFGAGEQKYIDIKFVPANINRGDRLTFTVDSFKVVAEKNENNNTYSMTF